MLNLNLKALGLGVHHVDAETVLIIDDIRRYKKGDEAYDQAVYFIGRTGGAVASTIEDQDGFWGAVVDDSGIFIKPTHTYARVMMFDKKLIDSLSYKEAQGILNHEFAHTLYHVSNPATDLPGQIRQEVEADAYAAKVVGRRVMKRAYLKAIAVLGECAVEFMEMSPTEVRNKLIKPISKLPATRVRMKALSSR